MTLSLAYSPCPNDTFIFDALVHGRVDTEGLRFRPTLADVEALNRAAVAERYDVTKLSYAALAHVQDRYRLLDAGSALGEGIGPLLIADRPLDVVELVDRPVAIPGTMTTAAFLLQLAYPGLRDLRPTLFSDIEAEIRAGRAAAGVIIHETRFTYAERGFYCLRDLGTFWAERTGLPIPLGGICVSRALDAGVQARVGRALARSVDYAMAHPAASRAYVATHAREMSADIQQRHIATYVNAYSRSLGDAGRAAVSAMFELAHERGLTGPAAHDLFVEQASGSLE